MRYSMEILRVLNQVSNKTRYFKKVCDQMIRISKSDYDEIRDNCDGVNNLFTEIKGDLVRNFTGCTYYINK